MEKAMSTATAERLTTETAILDRVREIVAGQPESLDMGSWHGCETTHCLAGWAQHLSGEEGDAEEIGRRLLPKTAAMPGFYCSTEVARAWLESRGYADDAQAGAFRDALVGMGWKHVDSGIVDRIDGVAWLDGNATLQAQSGGVAWLYGNATLQAQSGGVARLYGNATLQDAVDGTIHVRSATAKIVNCRRCTIITERWNGREWVEIGRETRP